MYVALVMVLLFLAGCFTDTKALRDITKQANPLQVKWPAAPAVPSGT